MRFGEAELREAIDAAKYLLRHRLRDTLRQRSRDELLLQLANRFPRSLAAHRAAQALRLPGAETSQRHRHLQHLLLVENHSQRLRQHRLERRMVERHRFSLHAPVDVRIHRSADDRPRPDDCHLYRQVIEAFRPDSRESLHLRARLDLEDAHWIGFADALVGPLLLEAYARELY